MTFQFHNTCPFCLRPFRVRFFNPFEKNGYPKVMATRKKRPLLPAKFESNRGRYFRNSTVCVVAILMENDISLCSQHFWLHPLHSEDLVWFVIGDFVHLEEKIPGKGLFINLSNEYKFTHVLQLNAVHILKQSLVIHWLL